MALSSLKFVIPAPPATGRKESRFRRPTEITVQGALQLQVRCEKKLEQHQPQSTIPTTSRRDAILCLTGASLVASAFHSTAPAEARNMKLENRRKIKEKLEMIREKAGVSKLKTEEQSFAKDREKKPSLAPPSGGETNPNSQNKPTESTMVEATPPK